MRRLLRGLAYALLGYAVGGVVGAGAITLLSSNRHDRGVEASMTGAFVTGPLGAVVAFARGARRRLGP